jgi:hypothetical protein
MTRIVDLTGQRFGRLVVLNLAADSSRNAKWVCLCDCGQQSVSYSPNLKNGKARSCGCLRRELPKLTKTKHGHKPATGASTEYEIWSGIIRRCLNPSSSSYPRYGGRGISVCERWRKFENFLEDMGPRPPGLTIDRLNNDGHYEPSNCAWRSYKDQARNKSGNRRLTLASGESITLREVCERFAITEKTLRYWLRKHGNNTAAVMESLRARSSNPKSRRRVTGKENIQNLK